MKLNIVKKKASSLREIASESIVINEVFTLEELLKEVCRYEYERRENMTMSALSKDEIDNQSSGGKITFGERFNERTVSLEKATEIMLQDYRDGLFRVFFNGEEYTSLGETIYKENENELVLIRLVMLAGRLW